MKRDPFAFRIRAFLTAAFVACGIGWLATTPAAAQAIRSGGAAGVSSALVCLLSGGTGCTMTGNVVFGSGTPGISMADGVVELYGNDAAQRGTITASSAAVGLRSNSAAAFVVAGPTADASATQPVFVASDTANLFRVYGEGAVRKQTEQTATCAAGVLALDPQSSAITVNANAAACVVTLAETSAATIGPGFFATITVTNTGAGVVTLSNVTNIASLPMCATTTGLGANDALSIEYANRTDDLWVATAACADNT